ncbi:MAG: hypothetical protein AB7H80_05275 [Candidatus Kapaibacterium sp.]
MRYSDELFKLIKSLTKSEKRYFKLFASMQGNGKKYLLLFDAIDRQNDYDEPALKEEFEQEKFVRQFAVVKGYLYNLVLKSLRLYHASSSIAIQLRELLTNVELLNDRGLVLQARKMFEKCLELATRHERFSFRFELSGWEPILFPEMRSSLDQIDAFAERQQKVCSQLQNLSTYTILLRKVARPVAQDYVRRVEDLEDLKLLIEHPLMENPEQALSDRGRFYYHWIYCTYHFAFNEYRESLDHAEKMVHLLEKDPVRLQEEFSLYLIAVGNVMTLYRRSGEEEKFQIALERLRRMAEELMVTQQLRSPRVTAELFQASYLCLLSYYIGEAEFSQGMQVVPVIEEGLSQHESYLKDHIRYKFYTNLSVIYFAVENYDKALYYNNRILLEREPVEGRQTYYAARLFNLVIHYELGNFLLLEHLVPSTYRYLLSRKNKLQLEEDVLSFFRKLPSITDRKGLIEAFTVLRDSLQEVEEDSLLQNGMRYFGYIEWLNSKILNRSFAETSKEYLRFTENQLARESG